MKYSAAFVLASFLLASTVGCSKYPSVADARRSYEGQHCREIKNGEIEIKDFKKTNGLPREAFGVKLYMLEFEAEILYPKGRNTECINPSATMGFLCLSQEVRKPGEVVRKPGQIIFEHAENGWRASGSGGCS